MDRMRGLVEFAGEEEEVDVGVVAEGDDGEGVGGVLEEEAGVEAGAAFEEVVVEFADVEAGVEVGVAEVFGEAGEREGDFVALGFGEGVGEGLDVGGDEDGFGHGGKKCSSAEGFSA